VDISLSTHSAGGVTALDFQLAQIVDELAAELPQAQ
jgi:pterin-4a-carbinolamine dehydratase